MRHGGGKERARACRESNERRGEKTRKSTFGPSTRPSVLCQRPRDHRCFCHPDADAGFRPDRLTELLTRRAAVTSHRRVYGPISASASAIEEAAARARRGGLYQHSRYLTPSLRLTACSSLSLSLSLSNTEQILPFVELCLKRGALLKQRRGVKN